VGLTAARKQGTDLTLPVLQVAACESIRCGRPMMLWKMLKLGQIGTGQIIPAHPPNLAPPKNAMAGDARAVAALIALTTMRCRTRPESRR